MVTACARSGSVPVPSISVAPRSVKLTCQRPSPRCDEGFAPGDPAPGVFEHAAILYDEHDAAGVVEQPGLCDGVAGDRDQVGKLARLYASQAVGPTHDPGIVQRGGPDRSEWVLEPRTKHELQTAAVLLGAQQVGARTDQDAVPACQQGGVGHALFHALDPGYDQLGQSPLC